MLTVGKSLYRSNLVVVFAEKNLPHPEVDGVFSIFSSKDRVGAQFVDDAVMNVKIFSFPKLKIKLVFENNRLRLEDESQLDPEFSKLGLEFHRIKNLILAKNKISAFGFNYDVFFRADNVIPQREIMNNFVKKENLEDIRDFAWQFTLAKDSGQKLESYFFKVVSPLELACHANFHFNQNGLPDPAKFQTLFKRSYEEIDQCLSALKV